MTDLALIADPTNLAFDITRNTTGADLLSDDGLDTAVLISLFTDALAPADAKLPNDDGDRRGTWMDEPLDGSPITDRMGSLFWLLSRVKATQQVRLDAIAYGKAALQWLIDDGIAASVDVTADWNAMDFLAIQIVITRGAAKASRKYDFLWSASAGLSQA